MGRDRLLRACAVGLGLFAVGAIAAPVSAQNPQQILDSLRRMYSVPLLSNVVEVAAGASRTAPGSSAGSQSAFGANFGDGFVGAGFASSTRAGSAADGSVVTGFGLLNSAWLVGVEVDISSLSTVREGFGQRGAIGLKIHKSLPKGYAVAFGAEDPIVWGGTDAPNTYFAVGSKVYRLREREGDPFGQFTLNFGVGNGHYRNITDLKQLSSNDNFNSVGVFGSAGLRVHEAVSLIADWPGQDLTLAASIVPLRWVPLVITPGISDLLGRVKSPDGTTRRHFTIGAGMGFKFSQVRNIFFPGVRG